ncbi:MAG: immune inhibitor A [Bacteroidales bacterium]|nr:immune inhibitor A [Bacteroidales bacterium]
MFKLILILNVFKAIFIPVQCRDSQFTQTREELEQTVLQAQEYFTSEMQGLVSFEFTLQDIVTLDQETSFYGHNAPNRKDEQLYIGVIEACMATDADFSEYDNDGDGTVDNVYLLMPGLSERDGAGEDGIWPHRFFINDCGGSLSIDGKRINSYAVSTESGGLASLCHEFGHVMGLSDLYDTDGERSGGLAFALGGTTLMEDKLSSPPHLCAIEKEILGIGECVTLTKGHWKAKKGGYYRLLSVYDDNYYLLEPVEGKGMAIYHVDRSQRDAGYSDYYRKNLSAAQRWDVNEINCRPDHQCAHLIGYFPDRSLNYFGAKECPLAVSNINSEGFDIIEPVNIEAIDQYQDAVIIRWKAFCKKCSIRVGDETVAVSGDSGFFCYTFEGLEPATDYDVEITAEMFHSSAVFRTKAYNPSIKPYIYLSGAERYPDGAFYKEARIPLRIYNAPDAGQISWFFDGESIHCDRTGYYTLEKSGVLRAEISWKDGTKDVIIKNITVR